MLSIVAFGGIRFRIGPSTIAINSVWRVALILCVLAVARHWTMPRSSLAARVRQGVTGAKAWFGSSTARAVVPVWAATHVSVLVVGFLALAEIGPPAAAARAATVGGPLLNLVYRWDTGWYLAIAAGGYVWHPDAPQRQQSIAFFPAYPVLMRIGGAVLGARPADPLPAPINGQRLMARTLAAGWLIALGSSIAALCALYKWSVRTVGRAPARRAVILLATFPFAVYYSTAYTEPLYLLGALGAFNAVLDGRVLGAGLWGGLVGLLRPNGFLLTVPLLMLAARQPRHRSGLAGAALMPCAGMLGFSAYIWSLTGRPFAWAEAHAAWGRIPATWDTAVTQRLNAVSAEGLVGYAGSRPLEVLNGAAVLLALVFIPVVWRRLGAAASVFVLINIVPPLFAGGLMSMGRLTSTMFPLFVAMGVVISHRHLTAWTTTFLLLQGLAAVLFFTWRPLV